MSASATTHRRSALWLAALAHRLSGLALALFLPLHFLMLGLALRGEAALQAGLGYTDHPLVKLAEGGLVFLLCIHMLGGIRLLVVGDGPGPIRTIAWCTGGAQSYFEAAIAAGADAFITGEISEPQAHYARESGVAFLACGHHATERFGAPALAAHVAQQLGLEHVFIDVDNPA